MHRCVPALLPALLLLAPLAGAGSLTAAPKEVACLLVSVPGPDGEDVPLLPNQECRGDGDVTLIATVREEGVRGLLRWLSPRLEFSSPDHDVNGPVDPEDNPRSPSAPADPIPASSPVPSRARSHVTVHFNVTWDPGCGSARVDYHAVSDNRTLSRQEVRSDARPLCSVTLPADDLLREALRALAGELDAALPAAGASVGEILRALTPAPGGEDPPPREAPAEADAQARRKPVEDPRAQPVRVGGMADAEADPTGNGTGGALALDADAAALEAGAQGRAARDVVRARAQPVAHAPEAPRMAPPMEAVTRPAADKPQAAPPRVAALEGYAPPPPAPGRVGDASPEVRVQEATTQPPPAPPPGVSRALGVAGAAGLLLLAGFALYQRIARPKALQHPARAALHRALSAAGRPLPAAALAAEAGLAPKSALYHLRYLARLGLLREERRAGEATRFALPSVPSAPAQAPLAERVQALVARRPGLAAGEMSEELGVTYGRLDRLLKQMLLEGRLESRVEAGRRGYFHGPRERIT